MSWPPLDPATLHPRYVLPQTPTPPKTNHPCSPTHTTTPLAQGSVSAFAWNGLPPVTACSVFLPAKPSPHAPPPGSPSRISPTGCAVFFPKCPWLSRVGSSDKVLLSYQIVNSPGTHSATFRLGLLTGSDPCLAGFRVRSIDERLGQSFI